jgi:hypothetical protein
VGQVIEHRALSISYFSLGAWWGIGTRKGLGFLNKNPFAVKNPMKHCERPPILKTMRAPFQTHRTGAPQIPGEMLPSAAIRPTCGVNVKGLSNVCDSIDTWRGMCVESGRLSVGDLRVGRFPFRTRRAWRPFGFPTRPTTTGRSRGVVIGCERPFWRGYPPYRTIPRWG